MGKEQYQKGLEVKSKHDTIKSKSKANAERLAEKLVTFRTFSEEEVKALIVRAYQTGWRDSLIDVITEE
jgi:hypothetical protein